MPSPRTSRSRPSIRGRRPRRTARSPATDNSSKARSNATEPTRSCRRKAPARARSSTRRPRPRRPRAAARPILEPALLRSKRSEASGNIMPDGPQTPASRGLRIVAITADADFEQSLRATFGRSAQIDLAVVAGAVGGTEEKLPLADATVLLVDLDATRSDEIAAAISIPTSRCDTDALRSGFHLSGLSVRGCVRSVVRRSGVSVVLLDRLLPQPHQSPAAAPEG